MSRMAELEAEKEQLSDQVYTERSELENTRQTKSFFENTLISITRQINDIKRVHSSENLAQQLQEEPTQPNLQDLVSLIQDLDSIKRSQELEINNLRLEMENQVDLLNKVSSADSDAKIQLDQALEEKQVLISTNQNLSNQVYSLSLKIADIEKELESMASYRNDLESTNQAWVAYEVTMRQQLDEAVQMSSEKEEKCHRLSAQISSLEGSLKELLELQSTTSSLEVSSLKNSLVQKENEIAALTRKLDTAFSRSQSSGKSPTTGVATANSLFGGVIGGEKASSMGNNHDVELLRGQLDLLQEQLELKETELLTSVSLLNTRLAQAEEMTAVYNERCESANASVEVYRVELDKYSKKIHELETEINQWRDASLSKLGAASSNNILSTSR